MSLGKTLFRIWLTLSLASLAIDAACFWLSWHTPAFLPDRPTINYVVIFMLSAPLPFALAVFLILLGLVVSVMRGLWGLARASHGSSSAAEFDKRFAPAAREREVFRVGRVDAPPPRSIVPSPRAQLPVATSITTSAESAQG